MNTPDQTKRQAMNAISHSETLAKICSVKMTGGIALYVARIREADRQAGTAPQQGKKLALERGFVRDL